MKKILAIVLALLVILSMTACANSTMKATEPTEKESGIIEDAFVSEIDAEFKLIFGDDMLFSMYEDECYSIVISFEGIQDIYDYYHRIPDEVSDSIAEMSNATCEAGLDNMFVVVSDIDQTELLIIYNGIDVTKEVLNEN